MNGKKKDLIFLNISSILLGSGGIFAKLIPMPAYAIICFRMAIAAVCVMVLIKLKNKKLTFAMPHKDKFKILVVAVLMTLHWVTFFMSIQLSTVAIGVLSLFTYPIFTILIEPFIVDKRWNFREIISAIIIFFGVYLIIPSTSLSNNITQGVLIGLLSAIFVSIRNIYSKELIKEYPIDTIIFTQFAMAGVLLLPFSLPHVLVLSGTQIVYLLVSGVVFTALAHTLYIASLRTLSASVLSLLASIQPVYAAIAGYLFLSEKPTISTVLGGSFILLTVVITVLMENRLEKVIER